MPIDPMIAASLLRGGATPAAETPTDDRAALISALRRHGDIGMLMNLEPTAAVGRALHERATGYEAQNRYEQALRRQEAQAQAQMQRYAAEQAMRERDYQFRVRQAQESNDMARQRLAMEQAGHIAYGTDALTGMNFPYNTRTGQRIDVAGMGSAPPGGQSGQAAQQGRPMTPAPSPLMPGASTAPPADAGGEGETGSGATGDQQQKPQQYGFVDMPPGVQFSDAQSKNFYAANALASAVPMLERVVAGGYRPGGNLDLYASNIDLGGVKGAIQGLVPARASTDAGQAFYNAGARALISILRPESGGAITEDEWIKYGPTYLPWPGDSQEIIDYKMQSLRERMNEAARLSGRGSLFWHEPPNAFRRENGQPASDAGSSPNNPIDLD